ncbi:hypothetical protein ACI2OX_18955 [Bacillus sp. N9]
MFNRILLANVPSWLYMVSVFFSATFIAFLQLVILFSGAAIFYGVHWPNFAAFYALRFLFVWR